MCNRKFENIPANPLRTDCVSSHKGNAHAWETSEKTHDRKKCQAPEERPHSSDALERDIQLQNASTQISSAEPSAGKDI